jgi:hypothetical protein
VSALFPGVAGHIHEVVVYGCAQGAEHGPHQKHPAVGQWRPVAEYEASAQLKPDSHCRVQAASGVDGEVAAEEQGDCDRQPAQEGVGREVGVLVDDDQDRAHEHQRSDELRQDVPHENAASHVVVVRPVDLPRAEPREHTSEGGPNDLAQPVREEIRKSEWPRLLDEDTKADCRVDVSTGERGADHDARQQRDGHEGVSENVISAVRHTESKHEGGNAFEDEYLLGFRKPDHKFYMMIFEWGTSDAKAGGVDLFG